MNCNFRWGDGRDGSSILEAHCYDSWRRRGVTLIGQDAPSKAAVPAPGDVDHHHRQVTPQGQDAAWGTKKNNTRGELL